MPPCQKCAALHRDAAVIVDDLIWGIVGRFWECPDVHRPLGRVCLLYTSILDHREVMLNAHLVREPPQGKAGADKIMELPGAVKGR